MLRKEYPTLRSPTNDSLLCFTGSYSVWGLRENLYGNCYGCLSLVVAVQISGPIFIRSANNHRELQLGGILRPIENSGTLRRRISCWRTTKWRKFSLCLLLPDKSFEIPINFFYYHHFLSHFGIYHHQAITKQGIAAHLHLISLRTLCSLASNSLS